MPSIEKSESMKMIEGEGEGGGVPGLMNSAIRVWIQMPFFFFTFFNSRIVSWIMKSNQHHVKLDHGWKSESNPS